MVRLSAIFIAACMVLIAGSLGAVLFLRFGFALTDSALIALGTLTVLMIYNAVASRDKDRTNVNTQVAGLARAADDLARQVAEFGRRLNAVEIRVGAVIDKTVALARPLSSEIEELSRLVKGLAEQVAVHDAALAREKTAAAQPSVEPSAAPASSAAALPPIELAGAEPARPARKIAAFSGIDRATIVNTVRDAIEHNAIELYLQPIVTLPQRKVRYYEAMSRFHAGNGDVVAAEDFLPYAESGALIPKLDQLSVLRCVQVVRRLSLKNREVGLFCNLSGVTLADAGFPQLLEFLEANRAIAPSLVFEFTQAAVRAMGPIEHEGLAALFERGYRFSMDNLTDLRVDPRELTERGFRFVKASAALLLNRAGVAATDIHHADLSDLLGRFGIDLIADRIETEAMVVDLLDYDVRFGQGFLFSTPRPVRAEALQGDSGDADRGHSAQPGGLQSGPTLGSSQSLLDAVAPFARTGSGRN
jgi:cyclic-di-GMP phosphodiesterase TipF (flagellum assembly factor)